MSDESKPSRIVRGQKVTTEKIAFARNQRKEMSPVERVLWNRIRDRQLGGAKFRRQQIVSAYIADFYCHQSGLAIEVDGDTHDDPGYDAARDRAFAAMGIRVLRFTNAEVLHETEAVLEVILSNVAK
jgi:very-short-patch-repair endonuclease